MPTTFKDHELEGWSAKAEAYGDLFGTATVHIAGPVLDAAAVGRGTRQLDVASGPGYVAAAGADRGADVIGTDFAQAMLEQARRKYPAVTEAYRVLRPGGRYAFTWWCDNERHEFFGLVYSAIAAHGTMDVGLPPAPPFGRFSDPAECRRVLAAAGFSDPGTTEVMLQYEVPTPQAVIDSVMRGGVRSALVLGRQTKEARARIEQAIREGAERFRRGDKLRFAFPAIVASGQRSG